MTRATRSAIAAAAFVLRSRVTSPAGSATAAALDVARNAAQALAEWVDDPVEVFRHALVHRRRYLGLRVADIDEAARAAGAAWVAGYGRTR